MYIEVIYDDTSGDIVACYESDTLPKDLGLPFQTVTPFPAGQTQARINIDTLTAMEIEQESRDKAILDGQGKPAIEKATRSRSQIIIDMFTVDKAGPPVSVPGKIAMPPGLAMRTLKRKP